MTIDCLKVVLIATTAFAGGCGSNDGGIVADANPAAPTCMITAPADGTAGPFDEMFAFTATADDPEDGALIDADVSWESDMAGVLGNGLTLNVTLAPPGMHRITCTATDSDGLTGQSTIDVMVVSPVAVLSHPADGETRTAGVTIPLVGEGRDLEDGTLTAAALVWTSDLDGDLGTGLTADFASPSEGSNTITLTVTDSDGNSTSASVTLDIVP